MSRYLLNCECGKQVPVEAGHAGGKVACDCGRTLEVPPLRALRHLPTEAPRSGARPQSTASDWGARQGIATVCLLAALLLSAVAGWSRWGEPTIPVFNPVAHTGQIERNIDALTPAQAWSLWVDVYRPLAEIGFSELKHPHDAQIRAEIERRRFIQKAALALAGAFGAVGLTAVFWPRSKSTKSKR